MLLIQAQNEDLVSVRALKNFAGKINRQGKNHLRLYPYDRNKT